MSKRLFVGGLAWATDDTSLKQAFEAHGEVTDARVITDRESGRSRGFGFVTFADASSASDAIAAMDGKELDGRAIRVNLAEDKPRRGGRGGGGGGGGRDRRW
jgi:RNA recognition motif-containing protein